MGDVLVLDFQHMYRPERFSGAEVLDFEDLTGVRGFLDPEAEEVLRESLSPRGPSGIHLIGDGNYHYLSRLFTSMISEPYDLLMLDHHTDLQRPAFGDDLLTCGSWLRQVLCRDPMVREVYLAGPPERMLAESAGDLDLTRVHFLPMEQFRCPERRRAFRAQKNNLPLYLSVDEDILRKEDLVTNWDQGDLAFWELTAFLGGFLPGTALIGADICGGMAPSDIGAESLGGVAPSEMGDQAPGGLFRGISEDEIGKMREQADLALIRAVRPFLRLV
ncbi:hypothetical protein [Clostridium vitabionis]|uniref:hypothetical protein n=1 Tax=Clostridium vitabionis TaxID=2784388 RepID=UPI001889EE1D|nr:hypothetical protein [Clostridium vitabionis]